MLGVERNRLVVSERCSNNREQRKKHEQDNDCCHVVAITAHEQGSSTIVPTGGAVRSQSNQACCSRGVMSPNRRNTVPISGTLPIATASLAQVASMDIANGVCTPRRSTTGERFHFGTQPFDLVGPRLAFPAGLAWVKIGTPAVVAHPQPFHNVTAHDGPR